MSLKNWSSKIYFFLIIKVIHAVLTFAELCCLNDPSISLAHYNKGYFLILLHFSSRLTVAFLLFHVLSSNSEIPAGEQFLSGPHCSQNREKRKDIWQKYTVALVTSAWMFVYMQNDAKQNNGQSQSQWGRDVYKNTLLCRNRWRWLSFWRKVK